MKRLIYLTYAISYLTASNLIIQKEKDEGKDIFHLTIYSNEPVICRINKDYYQKDSIECTSTGFDNNISLDKKFDFFDLTVNHDHIVLKPKYKYMFFDRDLPIYKKKLFAEWNKSKIVDIVFYKETPTYINPVHNDNGLGFDIDFKVDEDFYIDVLNDELKPVISINDVSKIDFLKKLFLKKDYLSVINKANRELKNRNIYSSDILLYKIRALDKILEDKYEDEFTYDDLENACDDFIQSYPSNKHLSEVIYFKIKSLYKKGKYKKASIIVQKLKKNFNNDVFSEKAQILEAKNLYQRVKYKNKANQILEKLLYNTKNVQIALESAFVLVGNRLEEKDPQRAENVLDKILKYKADYLKLYPKKSYKYAKLFASNKYYNDAVKIAEILIKNNEDEELVKNLALWQEKANMKDLAYKNYKKYLKLFPDGKYYNFVKERLDKVLLDLNDTNVSKKLQNIENIIKKYSNDPIYKKALIEKVKLYIKEKKFEEVLKLKKDLSDLNQTKYIDIAAKSIFDKYMNENDCMNSVDIVSKYKIVVDSKKLYKLTKCYYNLARYKESFELAKKYIMSEDSKEITKWYYIAIKSATKLRDYTSSIKLYQDMQKINNIEDSQYKDIYFDIFESYFGLSYIDKALETVRLIEKNFANDPRLLDVYYKIIKYYKDKKSDLMIVYYSKKLLNLQSKLKVGDYSPIVDIMLIKSLKNLHRYKEALSYFANAYLSKNINDEEKAQLLYLAGEISLKESNIKQAREFFIKCGTDVKNRMWQKVCSESLKLIEDK